MYCWDRCYITGTTFCKPGWYNQDWYKNRRVFIKSIIRFQFLFRRLIKSFDRSSFFVSWALCRGPWRQCNQRIACERFFHIIFCIFYICAHIYYLGVKLWVIQLWGCCRYIFERFCSRCMTGSMDCRRFICEKMHRLRFFAIAGNGFFVIPGGIQMTGRKHGLWMRVI